MRRSLFLFGVGLGGLLDGILFHQILQWHHMLSATGARSTTTVGRRDANTLADGLFHAGAWLVVVVALFLAVRADRTERAVKTSAVAGWLLIGLGSFNLAEGLVDHQLLGVHHLRDDLPHRLPWDVGFLLISALVLLGGVALVQRSTHRERSSREVRAS